MLQCDSSRVTDNYAVEDGFIADTDSNSASKTVSLVCCIRKNWYEWLIKAYPTAPMLSYFFSSLSFVMNFSYSSQRKNLIYRFEHYTYLSRFWINDSRPDTVHSPNTWQNFDHEAKFVHEREWNPCTVWHEGLHLFCTHRWAA